MIAITSRGIGRAVLFGFLGAAGRYSTALADEPARRAVVSSPAPAPALVPRLELPAAPRPAWGLSQLVSGRHAVRPPEVDRAQLRREALASAPTSARNVTLTRTRR